MTCARRVSLAAGRPHVARQPPPPRTTTWARRRSDELVAHSDIIGSRGKPAVIEVKRISAGGVRRNQKTLELPRGASVARDLHLVTDILERAPTPEGEIVVVSMTRIRAMREMRKNAGSSGSAGTGAAGLSIRRGWRDCRRFVSKRTRSSRRTCIGDAIVRELSYSITPGRESCRGRHWRS